MLDVTVKHDALVFGDGFVLTFQRTLRIPDDGRTYPLPPGLGAFPIRRIGDYRDRVPAAWAEHGGVFIPMYQREALWILFQAREWKPNAVKIAVGKVNAVSGKLWDPALRRTHDDYLVCPPQPWLDGINAGKGFIRQFVAMPLGMGYTVEAQVTGEECFGGIQIIVYEPKPGRFPDRPPPREYQVLSSEAYFASRSPAGMGAEMGLAAGGKMKQKIYPDPYGIDAWDEANSGRAYVHIANSLAYREITGMEPPPTPVSARLYAQYGFPWYDLYDEKMGDIAPPDALQQIKTVKQIDQEKCFAPQQDDAPVGVPGDAVITYKLEPDEGVADGN
jgi:hypothetical protein